MEDMIQLYMEETEDMLQMAEECMIRLEIDYSQQDVNELFRIAHTIKGSSHMVGYEDIGNLMHKIEDMLDCVRNGLILFDQSIISLCFEGLDTVKKMLIYKKQQGSEEVMRGLVSATTKICQRVEVIIIAKKKEEEISIIEDLEQGIISSLLNKKSKGKNKYYITFFIEEDAPMVSPVLLMIFKCIEEIGTLLYSSVKDSYFYGTLGDNDIKTLDIIITTDIDEAELYTDLALFYIERINIMDLSRNKVQKKDYSFISDDHKLHIIILNAFVKLNKIVLSLNKQFKINKRDIDLMKALYVKAVEAFGQMKNKDIIKDFFVDFNRLYTQILEIYDGKVKKNEEVNFLIQTQLLNTKVGVYNKTKGKHIVSIFKAESDSFIMKLKDFIGKLNKKSTLVLLMDLSKVKVLNENAVKDLIEMKKQLEVQYVEVAIIAEGAYARKLINIFDSIKILEEFDVFSSDQQAVLETFQSENILEKISKKIKDVQHE